MKRKILYVLLSLEIGGLERVVINLVNSLNQEHYEPYICCINKAGELAGDFKYPERVFVIGKKGRNKFSSIKRINDLLRYHSIDIVHSHNTPGLLYSFFPAKLSRIPIVHTIHGLDRNYDCLSLLNLCEKWMSRFVSRFVCVSEQLKMQLRGLYGLSEKIMAVVYNGVALERSIAEEDLERSTGLTIGSVGRLSAEKNYSLLLEGFAGIVSQYSNSRLVLVGGGNQYSRLVEMRDELSLEDRVIFTGPVMDVKEYLENFDLFVLTSLNEGISISILEAMSLGKICIVSDVGGNVEIIKHGQNGFLFKSNELEDLIEKIKYVIKNLEGPEMAAIKIKAHETVRDKFSLDTMVEQYCKIYDDIMR